jgi:hypothetical protein
VVSGGLERGDAICVEDDGNVVGGVEEVVAVWPKVAAIHSAILDITQLVGIVPPWCSDIVVPRRRKGL